MPADYDTPVSVWFFALSPCHACQLEEAQKGETQFAGLMLYGHGVGPDQKRLSEPLKIPASATKVDAQNAPELVSYLQDFIPLVGHLTAMLYPHKGAPSFGPALVRHASAPRISAPHQEPTNPILQSTAVQEGSRQPITGGQMHIIRFGGARMATARLA